MLVSQLNVEWIVSSSQIRLTVFLGRRMHGLACGGCFPEARTHQGGEARSQLYDGYAINEKGKTQSARTSCVGLFS